MHAFFLEGNSALTKLFERLPDGSTRKTAYPHIYEVTSYEEDIKTLADFELALKAHAAKGRCLLKGQLSRALVKESRAGTTDTNGVTDWVVFDLDGLSPGETPDSFLKMLGLHDIDHVVQYSASQGIIDKTLRAHIFMLLEKPMAAPLLKQWLIGLNHSTPSLSATMELTKTGNSIRWPLDISACQNDKLIYIAPPILKNIKDPVPKGSRIQFVLRKKRTLSITDAVPSTAKNRERTVKRIEELREADGLPKRKITYKMHGAMEVMVKPDQCTITELKVERGFVYFNLNGGDSWGYYHPENNPDYIFNFKGEPVYLTKELLPDYWEQLTNAPTRVASDGLIYLAFLDRLTSVYHRGVYDPQTDKLDLQVAKNETQVRHFGKQFGVPLGEFIPEWTLTFDPHSASRVDIPAKTVNTFEPTVYMKSPAPTKPVKAIPKTIMKVVTHALGGDPDVIEHFINWVAFILQRRDRTGTAWVLHGTHGCLAGDTLIEFKRGKRNAGRPLTIKDAYAKWTGQYATGQGRGKAWDLAHTTFAKSVRDNATIGFHEVHSIVESGVKQLYRLTLDDGSTIRATANHMFMRPHGKFAKLKHLVPGDALMMEGPPNNTLSRGGRDTRRVTVHSVPHHPYAWQHIINGKNYKRTHRARLVYEAALNGLSYDAFLAVLRTDATRAAELVYLPNTVTIHHVDENPGNDTLDNLQEVDAINHAAHHAKEVGKGYLSTRLAYVVSVAKETKEMTYDMVMKAPYHNYVANGFVVHNTGKGILMNKILRPLFGASQTAAKRMEELNEPYNHFMQQCFLVFVDEVQTSALQNERGVMAKLKNFITEPFVSIRAMYAGARECRNYTNWMMSSNQPDPVSIDREDRRFNVGKYQSVKLQVTDKEVEGIERELQAFHDYLMAYVMDPQKAMSIIDSADRQVMISISESSVDTVASALLTGDFEFFIDQLPASEASAGNALDMLKISDYKAALAAVLMRTDPATGECSISRDELRTMFDYTVGGMPGSPHKFTSLLKHHRIHVGKVWIPNKSVNGIKVTWLDLPKWATYKKALLKPTAPSTSKR